MLALVVRSKCEHYEHHQEGEQKPGSVNKARDEHVVHFPQRPPKTEVLDQAED